MMITNQLLRYSFQQFSKQLQRFTCKKCVGPQIRLNADLEAEEFNEFMQKITPILKNRIQQNGFPDQNKVIEYVKPKELEQIFKITDPYLPKTTEQIFDMVENIMKYSVRTEHPRFFNQLYTGTDPIGYLSELLVAALNTNVHTYAVAPVLAVLEVQCIKLLGQIAGLNPQLLEGHFVPGGTFGNISGFFAARHCKFPHVRRKGWQPEDQPIALCSEQCHYSIQRACMMAGMGMDQCIPVKSNLKGQMIPEQLEEAILKAKQEGKNPFYVNATAGTTVMGGFDDFVKIGQICKKYGCWLHIDACWGGHVIFSKKLKHLLSGSELADSISFDPHKGLSIPIFNSVVLINNHKNLLAEANATAATYLFKEHEASDYDLATKTLQCGRRADVLKFWLALQRHGLEGFEKRADYAYENAQYIMQKIKERKEAFQLVEETQWCNVCFWYIPKAFRNCAKIEDIYPILDKVIPLIYKRMQREGTMLVPYQPLIPHNLPNFFRIIMNQLRVQKEDLDFVLDEINRLGEDITQDDINKELI